MAFINSVLGITAYPRELQTLSLKYFCLQIIVSGIYLSYSWISLYYLAILDSFSIYGFIVAIGMLCGAILDIPLGILTDKLGQKVAFCGALFVLMIYYLGLIIINDPTGLLILEILVGIYSALISGSFISWFLNTWELLAPRESNNKMLFRNVMGNISFAKALIIAFTTLTGGFLIQQVHVIPQIIFLIQAIIAILGIILGVKFISKPQGLEYHSISKKKDIKTIDSKKTSEEQNSKYICLIRKITKKYGNITPFFISFSLLTFTSISFTSLIFSPLLYEISSSNKTFHQADIVINYTAIALIIITLTRSFSDFIYAISSRFSGKITSFIQSPYKGILIIYIFDYPLVWLTNLIVLSLDLTLNVKLCLIILIFLSKIMLSGFASGLHWQLYLDITSSKIRSSQESLFNTINLIISLIGMSLVGKILDFYSFTGAILFLFFVSCSGILVLSIAKYPNKTN